VYVNVAALLVLHVNNKQRSGLTVLLR